MELTRNLIKVEEAAEILTCGPDTVRALIREGKLPVFNIHKKVVRLDRRDVEEYLRSCCSCRGRSSSRVRAYSRKKRSSPALQTSSSSRCSRHRSCQFLN